MSDPDRPWLDQFDVQLPGRLQTSSCSLQGVLMNLSPSSVLFAADGHLTVVLDVGGKSYKGRLVRAGAGSEGRMSYVVQLEEALPVEDLIRPD